VEHPCDGGADAAAGAGDECHSSFEADASGVTTSPRTNIHSFAVVFLLGFVSHVTPLTAGYRDRNLP
jgi:hypothetical protein